MNRESKNSGAVNFATVLLYAASVFLIVEGDFWIGMGFFEQQQQFCLHSCIIRRMKQLKKIFNSNYLKLIAIIAMTIDHSTDLLYPGFPSEPAPLALHFIGRLTAPIMWFFVCEGYHYTRNVKKYMLRLGIFAVISHFAYCFGLGISLNPFEGGIFNRTSVMYPLFIAVVVLYIEDNASSSQRFFSTKHPRAAVHMALLYSLTDIGEAGRDPEELAAGFVYNLERLIGAKEGSLNKLMVLFG